MINGKIRDLDDTTYAIEGALIRNNGNEIAFDFHQDGYDFSVVLRRERGTLFFGRATATPGGDVANLTCRVYEDREEGITLIRGRWAAPGYPATEWLAELEIE